MPLCAFWQQWLSVVCEDMRIEYLVFLPGCGGKDQRQVVRLGARQEWHLARGHGTERSETVSKINHTHCNECKIIALSSITKSLTLTENPSSVVAELPN